MWDKPRNVCEINQECMCDKPRNVCEINQEIYVS